MTIRAKRKFRLPLVGEISFTKTLKPGGQVGKVTRVVSALDEDTTAEVTRWIDGPALIERRYVDKSEDINRRGLTNIRTRFGRVDVSWEPTLSSQAKK